MEEAKKARREAKQKAMLARISQLKRVCICRMYCRGENIDQKKTENNFFVGPRSACEELMELEEQIQK